ncbi:DNA-binding transcriptional regulator, XRE-family HTH domain [Paenibacillus algorifonticola]|uniref:DNA-binding transcriptional regulator, XRE-family HTH domain n=1 Tax=Paenibacillus algorifonticola TaxID=684063 RepID=A0A1I2INU4_9BACL|nr:helix-turn-helix transcriptional regulator [Paenibacillus algorifonticola]SFF43370.1 DNA-binding transcriptional regulator, XRE-family HTH domain [Paenibacillus algorifonticola]
MENHQLAQRVRAFRKLKGYTQQELAKVLGVSVAVLGSLERGTRKADAKLLIHISNTLGISYEELTDSESNGSV